MLIVTCTHSGTQDESFCNSMSNLASANATNCTAAHATGLQNVAWGVIWVAGKSNQPSPAVSGRFLRCSRASLRASCGGARTCEQPQSYCP